MTILEVPRRSVALASSFTRTFPLDGISIRADGTGRTVEAYAAVFDVQKTISDFEGSGYNEIIDRASFDRTISQRGLKFGVFFNHGLDIYGNPVGEFSKPIGVPLEVRADTKGVLTVTKYLKTPLGDQVLEMIREDAVRGQSFSGKWIRSTPDRGPYRSGQTVRRLEVAMREYGPSPFPYYEEANIVGVRSAASLVDEIAAMTADERAELARLLGTPNGSADPGTTEPGALDADQAPDPLAGTTPPAEDIEAELELRRRRLQL